jgi:hypothetical protein
MTRRLNDKQVQELNHLKEWCTSILQFEKALYAPAPSEGGLLEIVQRTYLERDLRGMRVLAKDLNEVPRDWWPSEKLRELNRLLKERFGEDLADLKCRDLASISRIRKRGKIRTENEFRLVHERAEEIWDDEGKRDEMEALNKLLEDYERPQ